jgi:hypothetical protein
MIICNMKVRMIINFFKKDSQVKQLEDWFLSFGESRLLFCSLKLLHIQFFHKLKGLPAGLKHVALCDFHVNHRWQGLHTDSYECLG